MSTPDIAAVMAAAMDAENRRRQLGGQAAGLGALMDLPQGPAALSVGKSSLGLDAVGEGLAAIGPAPAQVTSYGPGRPVYADGLVGGQGYGPGGVETVLRSLADQVFRAQDRAAAAGPGVEVISPQAAPRRSLWARLAGRLRRR